MADVTVLGAGGATVTIALTSAQNAAAAQIAVDAVNKLTAAGLVDMQIAAGAGSLPAPGNVLAGAVFTGTGFSGGTGDQYLLLGANGEGANSALGGANFRTVVVAGNGSDLSYGNLSQDGQVWLGKNKANVANLEGNVTVNTDDGSYLLVSDKGTTNTVNLGAGAILSVADLGGEMGATTVNAAGAATVVAFGDSTVASSINLQSGKALVALIDSGSALINPGAANVTVVGDAGGNGSATLFGGTGSAFVADGIGKFTGGSQSANQGFGFRNVMFSSTVSGSATLVGGDSTVVGNAPNAPKDVLIAAGKGQTLIAGTGNASLFAVQETGATGGSTFQIGAGFSTVFGYDFGGNTFSFFGFGAAEVQGHDETEEGTQVANLYFDTGVGTGSYIIGDFVSGLDVFQVTKDFTISFLAADDPANVEGVERTTLQITGGATYTFFDTTADGNAEILSTDVTKLG